MRVAVDTRSMQLPLTGIGHFVHRLIDAMLPMLTAEETLLSFNGWGIRRLDRELLDQVETVNLWRTSAQGKQSFRRAASDKTISVLRQVPAVRNGVRALQAARFHAGEDSFDLYHAVNFVTPGTAHKPVLPFIHDLSHIRLPRMHPKERVTWLERQLKRIANVPYVQTNSQFSKSEIVAILGVPADRIYVTYAAPGVHFRSECDDDESWLSKHRLASGRYFLMVGTREPRKNFRTLAQAYTALPAATQAQFPLISVGPPGWGDLAVSPAVERAKAAGRIRLIGYVADRELAALYRNTRLFAMPSIYEGFGMPVVEAMACGARVALSRIPVFEEVAGGYGRYVDPMDVEGWRQVMQDAIHEATAVTAARRPPPNLARFSWHSSAATTLALYRRLAQAQ